MLRRMHVSLSDQKKLSHYKCKIIQDDFVKLLCSTDKTKARKIIKQVMDANPRFSRFCAKVNLLEMKHDQLVDTVGKCSTDDQLMLGFIVIFEKIEDLRMAEI